MQDKIKDRVQRVREHISDNKWGYVFGITTAVLLSNTIRTARNIEVFLTSKDIDPLEFWLTPEDYKSIKE